MKKGLFALFVLAIASFCGVAFAQEVVDQATTVAEPTFLNSILEWIEANGALIAMAVGLGEGILRIFPTKKAMSILVVVKYAASGVAKLLSLVADIADKLTQAGNVIKK